MRFWAFQGATELNLANLMLSLSVASAIGVTASRSQSADINLKIGDVIPCVSSQSDPPLALASLVFDNIGADALTVAFCSRWGKGGNGIRYPIEIKKRLQGFRSAGAEVSIVTYRWINEAGEVVVSDKSFLCQKYLDLKPGTSDSVQVLIKSPGLSGKYRLEFTFDNGPLFSPAHSYNSRLLAEKVHGTKAEYFTKSTSTAVELVRSSE